MWQCFTHNICNIKDHSNRRSSERKHNGAVNPKEHRKMVLGAFETRCHSQWIDEADFTREIESVA
jgi:hypothetical protein